MPDFSANYTFNRSDRRMQHPGLGRRARHRPKRGRNESCQTGGLEPRKQDAVLDTDSANKYPLGTAGLRLVQKLWHGDLHDCRVQWWVHIDAYPCTSGALNQVWSVGAPNAATQSGSTLTNEATNLLLAGCLKVQGGSPWPDAPAVTAACAATEFSQNFFPFNRTVSQPAVGLDERGHEIFKKISVPKKNEKVLFLPEMRKKVILRAI